MVFNKLGVIIILLSLFLQSSRAQTIDQKIDQLLDAYQQQNQFNGTALVSYKGKIVLQNGFGYSDVEKKEANTAQHIFQIGSVTKQFTSLIILKLAEQKKLQLTDKLSKYFPKYPGGNNITVHHLLTHTSGIYNYTNDVNYMKEAVLKHIDEPEMIALFADKPLDFKPGTEWGYSNSGYMLLGYIIEKVTKKTYYNVVREFIFKPLKMKQSGFDFVGLKATQKAKGYFAIDAKNSVPSTYVDSSASYAAGAIYSTTEDLLKWHYGLLQNKLVARKTIEKAFTPYKKKYGYGWVIDSVDKKRITTHGGSIFGFNANFTRIEEDDICIALLNNVGNPKLEEITQNIIAILYNKPYKLPEEKKETKVDIKILNSYVGTYEVMPQFQIEITVEEGRLMAQATNQPKFELYAQNDHYFFLKSVEAEVEFVKDDVGKITKLILYQGGRKTDANKIK